MGGLDKSEPPLKRFKDSVVELDSTINNSLHSGPIISFKDLMARSVPSEGKEVMVGSKGVIKRVEFVRLITKTLYSLGYVKSGKLLEEESGIDLHSSAVILLRKQVLDGNWDESIVTLQKIGLNEQILKSASLLIREYKFFNLLENDRVMDALKTLRSEIAPLKINKKRLHELSGCIIFPSLYALHGFANLDIDSGKVRLKLLEELQNLLPPAVMIPERRLENLVEQALYVQRDACFFHNPLDDTLSLFVDHQCGKDRLPFRTVQIHDDGEVSLKYTFHGHQKPVVMVAWSPDDHYLLSCGMEETIRCWDIHLGVCLREYEKNGFGLTSCVWSPDGKLFFTGLTDRSIALWDLEGNEVECLKGQRTTKNSDMAITQDGRQIITLCHETTILLRDREAQIEQLIEENQIITSFAMSRDEKFLLVNLSNQEIHLWSIANAPKLLTKYKGHKRSRFVIRSCFGGFNQAFVASGSEDSQVYIWHRATGDLIQALPGHSGAVNCVSWNPVNPHMLASASDDRTIRIWGLNRLDFKPMDASSNGFICMCNGSANGFLSTHC
ncbi:hypothetical protein HPP92_018098 [Vanilla planifolia]|uniref:Uncharacterized protein n=1 Tax=Vanilla planifolia TaxID=51239 RepID=A0A835Q962_VANPL|nr:hypothetical protein HPP92_018686 [Vanilla planifolia]KAG0468770.1 hypothetical protein HPP92_018098 [Vanilla planifolia]